ARVALPPDDDVSDARDAAQSADVAPPRRELDVLARRRGIARRVVVTEDHGGGRHADERAEHVARLHLYAVEGAARDAELALDAVAHVERHGPELLDPKRSEARAEVRPDVG